MVKFTFSGTPFHSCKCNSLENLVKFTFFWHSSTNERSVKAIGGMGGGGRKKSGGPSSRKGEDITEKLSNYINLYLSVCTRLNYINLYLGRYSHSILLNQNDKYLGVCNCTRLNYINLYLGRYSHGTILNHNKYQVFALH